MFKMWGATFALWTLSGGSIGILDLIYKLPLTHIHNKRLASYFTPHSRRLLNCWSLIAKQTRLDIRFVLHVLPWSSLGFLCLRLICWIFVWIWNYKQPLSFSAMHLWVIKCVYIINPRRHKVKMSHEGIRGGGSIGHLPSTFDTIHPID